MEDNAQPTNKKSNYLPKVWATIGITILTVIVALLSWKTIQVFLFILAGTIIAVYFHGFAGLIARKTKLSSKKSLALSIVTSLLFIIGVFYLIGTRVSGEAAQFSKEIPSLTKQARQYVDNNSTIQSIFGKIESSGIVEKASPLLSGFFNSTLGFFGDLYVVLFIGVFFTAAPELYKSGIVKLLPARARPKGSQIVAMISTNLRSWLKGMLFSMLVVFVLTAIGLAILGIELWLILALIAGLLSFIPNFGPIIAIIPAALVALSQSPTTALWVILLYCLIQVVESNFITPLVQQELINTPPALIIISQVFIGILLGGWGVVLATPILILAMVLINELYVKKQDELSYNTETFMEGL